MRFGELSIDEAEGAILAHMVECTGGTLKKGHKLSANDVNNLRAHGVICVLAAKLEADDIGEDQAAAALAQVLGGKHVRVAKAFTGRANLFAKTDGVLHFDASGLHAVNRVDEKVTVATLPVMAPVKSGQMLATVKIIPFSVPKSVMDRVKTAAASCPLHIFPYRLRQSGDDSDDAGREPVTRCSTRLSGSQRIAWMAWGSSSCKKFGANMTVLNWRTSSRR